MKKPAKKPTEEIYMNAPNCVAILAILAEMAKRVNENISKVELRPIEEVLTVPAIAGSNRAVAEISKA
jgi:hypothetical protein